MSKSTVAEAEGWSSTPKGWTPESIKKFGQSLVKGGATKEDFFKKCVEKMKDKLDNPEGFCASVKDEVHGSTFWRGKGKTPQQAGKDVKAHQNVEKG
jgi:DNA-binding protein H-NS